MAQAVITPGYMRVEGGLRARCLEWFLLFLVPFFAWFIIHQTSDWRPYFIRPAFEKIFEPSSGQHDLYDNIILPLRLSVSKFRRACARARLEL